MKKEIVYETKRNYFTVVKREIGENNLSYFEVVRYFRNQEIIYKTNILDMQDAIELACSLEYELIRKLASCYAYSQQIVECGI